MGLTHCYKTTVFLHLFKYSTTSPELTLNQSINCSDPNRYRSIAPDLNPNEFAAEPKWICGWGRVLVFATVDNCWSFTNVQRSSRSLWPPQIFSSISFTFSDWFTMKWGVHEYCRVLSCRVLSSFLGRVATSSHSGTDGEAPLKSDMLWHITCNEVSVEVWIEAP